jgi:endonuclease III
MRSSLSQVLDQLQAYYGRPRVPKLHGPWEMVLWENAAYLVDDDRRRQAFQTLKKRIGTEPGQILSASDEALLKVTGHGILADQFAGKLRTCARIALEEFDGNLRTILELPFAQAKKALRKFPGIGEPGAEKILLLCQTYPILALDSNGLRVLLRLGFGEENKSYCTTYRLVQKSVAPALDKDLARLIQAHLLLRQHGQELCRRTRPECKKCPLASDCAFYQSEGA